MKKKTSLLITIIISIFIFCFSAGAVTGETADTEIEKIKISEEENVYYSYDTETKTLVFSGTGAYTTDCGDSIYSGIGGLKFEAFSEMRNYRKTTEKIIIEEGITTIGGGSFAYFENLKAVELPETLTEIQPYAFFECYNLESITLPESLEKIGFEAFRSCRSLTELTIPENVKEIGGNFILDTISLAKLDVSPESKYYTSENNVLYTADKTVLIAVAQKQVEVTIPENVTKISDLAFALSSVKEITVPASVADFGKGTFYKSAIEKITFAQGIKIDAITSYEEYFGDECAECYGAFEECTNLKSLSIPDSVKELGFRPIANCCSLERLYLGENVESIDSESFYNCKSLKKIIVNKNNDKLYVKKGALYSKTKWTKNNVTELTFVPVTKKAFKIPADVFVIGEFAFANSQIKKINIPKNVRYISNGAFYNCQKLKSITFAQKSKLKNIGFERDGDYYNADCCYDKPDINRYATFYNCKKLRTVSFPDSMKETHIPLFENCKKLKSVHFGKNFGSANFFTDDYFMFFAVNCGSLGKITFSEDNSKYTSEDGIVYSKDKTALLYYPKNRKDKTFIIPESVRTISTNVFKGCKNLKRIKFVHDAEKYNMYGFGIGAFGKKTVLVKKDSQVHKALKVYQENHLCKVKIKFY